MLQISNGIGRAALIDERDSSCTGFELDFLICSSLDDAIPDPCAGVSSFIDVFYRGDE